MKTLKQNLNFVQTFYWLFGCLKASFGPLTWRQSHHPMLIKTLFQVRIEGHWGPRNEVGSQRLTGHISRI